MGCSPGDTECNSDEKPAHAEQIANGFWLGQTEVTQAAWKRVTDGDPSFFRGDRLPVENVDWNQASLYCIAIGGRLPTEKEWEYAARAGTTGAHYGALDAIAWYSDNSGKSTHPVGLKQANAYGLYDMLGNVWEWVADDWAAYPGSFTAACAGCKDIRGGSFVESTEDVRASFRFREGPTMRDLFIGFRCVGGYELGI
jgi:formylglycine-generating enzyme required for sulfatase activity